MIKSLFNAGVVVLLLFVGGCSSGEDLQETDVESMKVTELQPVYAEMDYAPVAIQDPVAKGDFEMDTIPANTDAVYDMDIEMDDDGTFHLDTHITVQNLSDDVWEHVVFYVIPNAFTEENKPDDVEGFSEFEMTGIQVGEEDVPYLLDGDTLVLELKSPLDSGESAEVNISYTITVPEGGFRLAMYEGDYFLAQFYPMLATYQKGWNKEDYNATGESYHTDFSDFTVTYDIPEGYVVFSSADKETTEESTTGKVEMKKIKDFFIAIMKIDDLDVQIEDVNGIEVRVISDKDTMNKEKHLETATESLLFFEQNIGDYPHEQLDVIMTENESGGMEYPGIVTVLDSIQDVDVSEIIAHEIAHQWFYGVVTNDAFHEPWVDEGMTQFATFLYLIDANDEFEYDSSVDRFRELLEYELYAEHILPANLPLDQYEDDMGWTYSFSVYSQPTYQLLKLFQEHGKSEGALQFLSDYFKKYQYKQVDSYELVNYLVHKLQLEDYSGFDEWLDVE